MTFDRMSSPRKDGEKKFYYRHSPKGCKKGLKTRANTIPSEKIEGAVLEDVFRYLGGLSNIEDAISAAYPQDLKKHAEELSKEKKSAQGKLSSIEKKIKNVVDAIADIGLNADLKAKAQDLEKKRKEAKAKVEELSSELESLPSKETIKGKASKMREVLDQKWLHSYLRSPQHIEDMSFEQKRKLVLALFAGVGVDGTRKGIYIEKMGFKKFKYEAMGDFGSIFGVLDQFGHAVLTRKKDTQGIDLGHAQKGL